MIAVIRGPYCTGALTPCGALPQLMAPHAQRRAINWCSTTRTVIGGRSNTWRRSKPTPGAPPKPPPPPEPRRPPHPPPGCPGKAAAAAGTRARFVPAPLVRVVDQRQRRPRMTRLPARLAAAAAAQRLRRRLHERRVRRGWLRRVGRVHPQPALQFGILGLQRRDPHPKLSEHPRLLDDQGGELVIRRTPIPGLHTMIIPCGRSRPYRT